MIYLNILKEHVNYVFKVLKCLNKRSLYFKLRNCEFYQKEIDFLKFVIKRYKVRINFEKLQVIKE